VRNWLKQQWFRLVTQRIMQRRVRNAGMALVYLNHLMVQNHVPRKQRRQFMRDLWRRPVSAYEIFERAMYGRVGTLEGR